MSTNEEAISIIMDAIQHAGYKPYEDIVIALDVAANELYKPDLGQYHLEGEGVSKSGEELIDYYDYLIKNAPLYPLKMG